MSQERPELGDLFRCERYVSDFPAGMSFRACLRRQLERQGSVRKGELGPPRRPFCAAECSIGRERRWAAEEAGVALSACAACGAALVGSTTCSACEARAQEDSKGPARGFLPERPDGISRVIWGPNAPDAPLGPPPSQQARPPAPNWTLTGPVSPKTAARRSRELGETEQPSPAPSAPADPGVPAAPAMETPMACSECGSRACHKATCSRRPGGAKAAKGEKTKAPAKPVTKAVASRLGAAGGARPHATAVRPLEGKTVRQLLDLRAEALAQAEAIDLEIRARREELDAALEQGAINATAPLARAAGAGG